MPQTESTFRPENLVRAHNILGHSYRAAGNPSAARFSWEEALRSWPKVVTDNPQQMALRIELLRSLGRTAEAQPIEQRLRAIGYKKLS